MSNDPQAADQKLLATKVMKATIAQYNAESLLTQREQVGYWKKKDDPLVPHGSDMTRSFRWS